MLNFGTSLYCMCLYRCVSMHSCWCLGCCCRSSLWLVSLLYCNLFVALMTLGFYVLDLVFIQVFNPVVYSDHFCQGQNQLKPPIENMDLAFSGPWSWRASPVTPAPWTWPSAHWWTIPARTSWKMRTIPGNGDLGTGRDTWGSDEILRWSMWEIQWFPEISKRVKRRHTNDDGSKFQILITGLISLVKIDNVWWCNDPIARLPFLTPCWSRSLSSCFSRMWKEVCSSVA